jgi:UDP-N-acetylglucosamine diphosphorylase / glucose-1-phosphate thymidylyltransferase / UDP-N-acetylgalactosamine diphosphorylase / glucosamine-1-phosphate N-acetyltransferase / galactosamine-1-phosphate N-acetyltransferase
MNLVLTMAGKYQRFRDEGFKIPKYLLPWGSKSILSEIISSLDNTGEYFKNIYLVANKEDEMYMPHVRNIMRSLNIPISNLFLVEDTKGQAETARLAVSIIEKRFGEMRGNLVFHNIDTLLYKRSIKKISDTLRSNSGYIDVFISSNHSYSYVLIQDGLVKRIAEKVVISDQATSGLYAFQNAEIFTSYYMKNDEYIIDSYKRMIDANLQVAAGFLYSENETIVLGTPSEFIDNSRRLDEK